MTSSRELSPFTRSLIAAFGDGAPRVSFIRAQYTLRISMRAAAYTFYQHRDDAYATFSEAIDTLETVYDIWVHIQAQLDAATHPPLALLRRLGCLAAHREHFPTAEIRFERDLDSIRKLIAWDESLRDEIEAGCIPDDPDFRASWEAFMDRYGHRSPDEFDLACPRFRETPERVLEVLLQPASPSVTSLTLAEWLTLPIWLLAEYHLRANDLLRHRLMYVFASIRANLLKLADAAVERGQLPDRDSLWLLRIDEVKRLDDGWIPDADLFKQGSRS